MTRQIITVDIAPEVQYDRRLKVSQYDVGRPLGVYIEQDGVPLDCSTYEATLYVLKPDRNYYEHVCTVDASEHNLICWETAEQETPVAGVCLAEIRITSNGEDIGTANFTEWVEESPTDIGLASDSAIESIRSQVKRAEEAAEAAEEAVGSYDAMTAEAETLEAGSQATASIDHSGDHPVLTVGIPAGATGPEGRQGQQGQQGIPGVSPVISVSDITGGHRVTITDAEGTHTFDVLDGGKGDPGQTGPTGPAGYSPTVTVTDITGGHRVTITDQQGQHPFDVMDGEDSAVLSVNGETGNVVLDGTKVNVNNSASDPETVEDAFGRVNRALNDVKDAIGTTSTTGETTEYLEITKKSRWNNSSTPSSSYAFARTTNVLTLTSAMKKVVSGTGYVLAKVMGSNDGSTYTILNVYWGISEFDISNIPYTYLTVDVQKPDQANFTDDDDVSSAVGIVEEISVETIRDIGNDVGENVNLQTEDKTSLVSAINEVNEKASSSTVTAVRDSIGYTVTGETSRDVELVGRKKFSPYSGTIGNDTARAYGEFTKSAEDISVNLSAKGTNIYYLGDVYYSTDNWATFTLYANVSSGNPFGPDQTNWNISAIPLNASVRVNIYKPNYAEFATDEDLTDVMTVISSQLTLRTIESVDEPSDMIGALLNRARQESKTLNIKLLGDSITHGVGSTGFNGATATTEPQSYDFTVILNGSTTYVTRSTGENSWAAKFEAYMYEKYGSNVINNGVSGGNAKMIIDSWESLVAESDDLIICMIGTNDRMQYNDAKLKETFRMQIETIQHKADLMGIPILFMSVVPVPVYYETHTVDGVEHTLTMHAEDIENIVHLVSKAEHRGYVSMFTEFLNYADYRDIDFTILLSDNLHPNDNGYNVMYDILLSSVGLGRKIPGATW